MTTAVWFGAIPEGWDAVPLYGIASERKIPNKGLRETNLLSLSYGRIVRKDIDTSEGLLPASFETYQIVRPDDIVLRMTDLQNDQRSLRSALVGETGIITSAYLALALRNVDPRFMAYQFRAIDLMKVFYSMGGGLRQAIGFGDLKRLPVLTPPLEEQRAVADYLDRETGQIDAFIAKNEDLITLLTERRAVAINDLVWSGASTETRRAPVGEALPHAPAHWLRVRNKQLYRERAGVSEDGEGELLTVSHLTGVTPRSQKNVNMFEAESTVGYKLVEPGDLAINTMWAWMGALGVATAPGIASPSYGVYRRIGDLPYDPRYFDYLYRSAPYVAKMTVYSRGITESRLRLYPETFLRLPIVVPPLEEQRAIADRIESQTEQLDAAVATARRGVELARERRAALISAAVTGKIDVGVAA